MTQAGCHRLRSGPLMQPGPRYTESHTARYVRMTSSAAVPCLLGLFSGTNARAEVSRAGELEEIGKRSEQRTLVEQ
jgi:hypothetical protein